MSERRKLHELISETFEPKPPAPPVFPRDSDDIRGFDGWYSHKGAWRWGYSNAYEDGDKWESVDYDTDEAANARLLEAMPSPWLLKRKDGMWCSEPFPSDVMDAFACNADRKLAIADAYCKWKGIEVSGEKP